MSTILPTDNKILDKTIQFYNNVDIGIDSALEKTEKVFSSLTFDIRNIVEIIKVENN